MAEFTLPPHSAYRYSLGCRCLTCTDAAEARQMEELSRPRRVKSTAPHGTAERASSGCRCQPCRHARKEVAR